MGFAIKRLSLGLVLIVLAAAILLISNQTSAKSPQVGSLMLPFFSLPLLRRRTKA